MSVSPGPSIAAVIMTKNEELNLPACLKSLQGWCHPIFVVDSGSTDRTESVARKFGAEFISHTWETAAKQWNWSLAHLSIPTEWVLALDADQRVTPELQQEIVRSLPKTLLKIGGYYLPRKFFFRGRWLRHGGFWPKHLLKLFRKGAALSDEREKIDFRFYVRGETGRFRNALIEDNLKERDITFWLRKHVYFINVQAQEEYLRRHSRVGWNLTPSLWGNPDQRTLWFKNWWYRLPPRLRPFLYFPYRYILLLGFLDGPQGALYCFLHSFWYSWMIAIRLKELERETGREE